MPSYSSRRSRPHANHSTPARFASDSAPARFGTRSTPARFVSNRPPPVRIDDEDGTEPEEILAPIDEFDSDCSFTFEGRKEIHNTEKAPPGLSTPLSGPTNTGKASIPAQGFNYSQLNVLPTRYGENTRTLSILTELVEAPEADQDTHICEPFPGQKLGGGLPCLFRWR